VLLEFLGVVGYHWMMFGEVGRCLLLIHDVGCWLLFDNVG